MEFGHRGLWSFLQDPQGNFRMRNLVKLYQTWSRAEGLVFRIQRNSDMRFERVNRTP